MQTVLCECGCGRPAPIAKLTDPRRGAVKGQPRRFIHGHQGRKAHDPRDRAIRSPTGCLEWQGALTKAGYGHASFEGRLQQCHRIVWQIVYGPIPDGKLVCHSCDNRRCIEPGHLFLGDQADNVADMWAKGRGRTWRGRGEQMPAAKLTEADVVAIRGDTRTQVVIAAQYGVSQAVVSAVKRRKTWAHVL